MSADALLSAIETEFITKDVAMTIEWHLSSVPHSEIFSGEVRHQIYIYS